MSLLATLELQSHASQAGRSIHCSEPHDQARPPALCHWCSTVKGRGQRTEVPLLPFGELRVQRTLYVLGIR